VKDVIRVLDLDRRQEVERGIGSDDGAPSDEWPLGAGRDVDCVALSRSKARSKRVERRRVEAEAVTGRVPSFGRRQLRVTRHGLRDVVSHLVPGE
jgi:hypothetical protein